MTNYEESYRIIEQAKQQRAEFIGRSIRKHRVVTLLVVAIPILLTQIQWSPSELPLGTSSVSSGISLPMHVSIAEAISCKFVSPEAFGNRRNVA